MFKGPLFMLLVVYVQNSSCAVDNLYWIGEEVWKLYWMVNEVKMADSHDASEVYDLFTDTHLVNQEIRIQSHKIYERINQTEKLMNSKKISGSFGLLSTDMMLIKCIDTIELSILSIDEAYQGLTEHMDPKNPHSDDILQNLTREIILKVEGKIEVIRKIITDAREFLSNNKTLVSSISDIGVRASEDICDSPQIISNVLVQLFTMVMIAELKVNVMLIFVNMYRYIQNEGWKTINSLAREQFEKQFAIYVGAFGLHIDITDALFLRRCDPEGASWKRALTHEKPIEIEGIEQTTIFKYNRDLCGSYSCNYIWFQYPDYCEAKVYDARSSCSYTSASCAWLGSVEACVLREGPHKFQYANTTYVGFLGKKSECSEDVGYKIGKWHTNIANCACNCYGNHNKVSVTLMESNVISNKVITGLRFIRKNNILHIQPREGILRPNGFITQQGDGWLPMSDRPESFWAESIDRENCTFFLDDLRLPAGYVLTGVKFNKVKRGTLTGFAIEIFGAPFNYKTGKLDFAYSNRISRQIITDNPGKGLSYSRISSLGTELPHTLNSPSIHYVTLKRSELNEDFGQLTLPLFDAMPLITDPPSVLGGIGIVHEGREGYAGFISLKVYGIYFNKYFSDFQTMFIQNDTVLFNTSHHEERELTWRERVSQMYTETTTYTLPPDWYSDP